MTDLLATPFTHRCVVCGSSFESHQRFATFCSTRCQEIYVNNGGFAPASNALTFNGTTAWVLICGLSLFTLLEPSSLSEHSISSTPKHPTPISIATLDANPYQPLSCLTPPALRWESTSHQEGFRLTHLPSTVWIKSNILSSPQILTSPDLSSFIKDSQRPLIKSLEVTPDLEQKKLNISWELTDPMEESKLILQMKDTCGTPIEQVENLSHASGIAQVEIILNQQSSIVPATQTQFTLTDLTEGIQMVTLTAIDQAGNRSAPVSKTLTILFPTLDDSSDSSTSESSDSSTPSAPTTETTKPENGTTSTPEKEPATKPENESTSTPEKEPTINPLNQIPNDRKGTLLKEMSSRHSSISEKDYASILLGAYRITPTFVIEAIHSKGFDIVLTGNNIRELVRAETGWDAGWDYYGVTFPNYQGYKRIWSSLKGGSNILVHEIGHAYDYAVGQPSQKEEFQQIYQAEASKLFPNGGLYANSADEYYAESFRMYLNERSKVKSKAPQTAAYFKTIFGN